MQLDIGVRKIQISVISVKMQNYFTCYFNLFSRLFFKLIFILNRNIIFGKIPYRFQYINVKKPYCIYKYNLLENAGFQANVTS